MDFIEFSVDFVIGGLASTASIFFSNPFDVIKQRMQLQNELKFETDSKIKDRIFFRFIKTAYSMARYENISKLQTGLSVTVLLHGFKYSVRLGGYEWVHKKGWLTDEIGHIIFWNSVIAGGFFGALGSYATSPIRLVKVKQQLEEEQGCKIKAWRLTKLIYNKAGVGGLWRGSSASTLETLFGSAVQLTVFEIVKDRGPQYYSVLSENLWLNTLIASTASSTLQVIIAHPLDLISTRLYSQGYDKYGKGLLYKNVIDCFRKIIKIEGIEGLYKGLVANYWRSVPQILLTLTFWDTLLTWKYQYLQKIYAPLEEKQNT